MTVKRYKQLKKKYFAGPIYDNWIDMVKQGFYTALGPPIPELDAEPGVKRWGCVQANEVWYRVYAPQTMKYQEV